MTTPQEPHATPGTRPVKSAGRALDVLDEIAAHGPGTQQQLSHRLGIPKSSVHALLRTMTARGWLETDPTGTVFHLGVRSLVVSSAYLDADVALARSLPLMHQVASVTGETVHLGRLDGVDLVYTAKRESVHPLRMFSAVGRRLPACSTALGRVMLAQLPAPERARRVPARITPLTPRTRIDRSEVLGAIAAAGAQGYAVESEESCVGIRCLAVALPVDRGVVDALGIAVPLSRLDARHEQLLLRTLMEVRRRVVSRRP